MSLPYRRRVRAVLGAVAIVLLAATTPAAAAEGPGATRSIFGDTTLSGSGWSACPSPITWSLDPGPVPQARARAVAADVAWALATWGRAAGLAFVQVPDAGQAYDARSHTTGPAQGPLRLRHIYVSLLPEAASDYLHGAVEGVAAPIRVRTSSREIVAGSTVLGAGYMQTAGRPQRRALVLHELGHALGLDHSRNPHDVMYPIVRVGRQLSTGDVTGVASLVRPCGARP